MSYKNKKKIRAIQYYLIEHEYHRPTIKDDETIRYMGEKTKRKVFKGDRKYE